MADYFVLLTLLACSAVAVLGWTGGASGATAARFPSGLAARGPHRGSSSHGSRCATVSPAISTGSRVNTAAKRGKAVMNMPSPVLLMSTLIHTLRKSLPIERDRTFDSFASAPIPCRR